MPKTTGLRRCIKCGGRPVLGLYSGYYLFGSGRWRQQQRGSFPARGYCVACFLRIARSRLDHSEFEALCSKLDHESRSVEEE